MPDYLVRSDGGLMVVTPQTDIARAWLKELITLETSWCKGALVVEPRYLPDLIEAIRDEGLEIEPNPLAGRNS